MSRIELRRMIQVLVVLACAITSVTSRSEGIGEALDKLKRSLPVDIQEAVKKKVDVPAAQPAEAGRPTTQSQSSSIKFPVPPCVSYSNVSARGAMAELTNGCGHEVTIVNSGKEGCGTLMLKAGMNFPAAPAAVCDIVGGHRAWREAGASCTCEGLARAISAAASSSPPSKSADAKANTPGQQGGIAFPPPSKTEDSAGSCITILQTSEGQRLRNGCEGELVVLQRAKERDGCTHTKFPSHARASLDAAVAICEAPQRGTSCTCSRRTVWSHG